MTRPLHISLFLVAMAALFAPGCNGTHTGNPSDDGPQLTNVIPLDKITKVDILFVMDNSGSMKEEQEGMNRIVNVLVTGDRDGDGKPEFDPAESVHLGVVSTDLGLPEIRGNPDPVGKCNGVGDDGLLLHRADGEPGSGTEHYCGNGVVDGDGSEACDGEDLNGETCSSLQIGEGELRCDPATCWYDQSGCHSLCGNGVIDEFESCDGEDLNGESCSSLQIGEGELGCDPATCRYDRSGCYSLCGNGVIDEFEDCDGEDLNGETCGRVGRRDSTPGCDPESCTYDYDACFLPCGNGVIDGLEECDGEDLNGQSCGSLGKGEGELRCHSLICTFDDTSCSGSTDTTDGGLPGEETAQTCKESYPLFIDHDSETDDPAESARDFTCMLQLGIEGCGFEQPLEAGLKALWPSDDERVTFFGPSQLGHGDKENAGFLREDSLLAIIVVSDEDDCSAQDIHIFEHESTADPEIQGQPANLRCFYNPDKLYPIERYLDNLKALRPGREDRIIFGIIAGVPPELVNEQSDLPAHILGKVQADPAELDAYYEEILSHPNMQEKIRTDGMNLEPSCTVANPVKDNNPATDDELMTKAYPPLRLLELARGFGNNGVVQSICDESFLSPAEALVMAMTNRMIESAEQEE